MSNVVNYMEKPVGKSHLSFSREFDWLRILLQIHVVGAVISSFFFVSSACWKTIFFTFFVAFVGHVGVAAGAHRLWAHQSYKAEGFLRFILMICQTVSGTGSIYDWVRWHRLHHKYYGTDLDPFNPTNGWWYAHIRSVVLKLSPDQENALKEIDMTDIEQDKFVMFQYKWYIGLFFLFTVLLPINAPIEYWNENVFVAIFLAGWLRYAINLHLTWLIHSAGPIWNLKPGEKYPCDSNLVFIINKTHWLSYHYLVPWDYQTSEYGQYGTDTVSTFIRVCAALELAFDLRTVDGAIVKKALTRSLYTKKDISECIQEIANEHNTVPKDHYLDPKKYY